MASINWAPPATHHQLCGTKGQAWLGQLPWIKANLQPTQGRGRGSKQLPRLSPPFSCAFLGGAVGSSSFSLLSLHTLTLSCSLPSALSELVCSLSWHPPPLCLCASPWRLSVQAGPVSCTSTALSVGLNHPPRVLFVSVWVGMCVCVCKRVRKEFHIHPGPSYNCRERERERERENRRKTKTFTSFPPPCPQKSAEMCLIVSFRSEGQFAAKSHLFTDIQLITTHT